MQFSRRVVADASALDLHRETGHVGTPTPTALGPPPRGGVRRYLSQGVRRVLARAFGVARLLRLCPSVSALGGYPLVRRGAGRGGRKGSGSVIVGHSPNQNGVWHLLADHLEATAALAAEFGASFGLSEPAWWAGLWHDIGKASCTFQEYLHAAANDAARAKAIFPNRDHKTSGAAWAAKHCFTPGAFAIFGHHGGLPGAAQLREILEPNLKDGDVIARDEDVIARVAATLSAPLTPAGPVPWPGDHTDALASEMWIRMLASCLVDADFLDTEEHFSGGADRAVPALGGVGDDAVERIESAFSEPTGRLASARCKYRQHVVARASESTPGIYRLTGPTGVGKTVAGFAAAVAHAKRTGQERIVIAVPYMTVTEQVADVLRSLLGNDRAVLEHHSGIPEGNDTLWRRLAAQNWDAPVVVTTTVQLFQSLFSNRPSAIRKLHRLANAVVILDEAQALPTDCLAPIIDGLNWLAEHARTTVVLQTATQPAFDLVGPWQGRQFTDWGDVDLGDVFTRVRWRHLGSVDHDELAAELASTDGSVLCVVNSVSDAHRVAAAVPGALSLTTRLCLAHRRARLKRITDAMSAGEKLRAVATQLVEAGVDLDFPSVWRAEGPLPSIAQAAGRCNRNGLLDGFGDAVTFDLREGRLPRGYYETATAYTRAAREAFDKGFDPENPDVLRWWYEQLYGFGHGQAPVAFDRPDPNAVQSARKKLDFPETARRFKMIENQIPLVVSWGDPTDQARVDELVERLRQKTPIGRAGMRFLGRFTVSLPIGAVRRILPSGNIDPIEEGRGSLLLGRWLGRYDDNLGLITDDDDNTGAEQW